MNRRSIRFRLTAWYTAILALTFAAMGTGVWFAIRESIHDTADKDLRARLRMMREYLENIQGGAPELVEELKEQSALAPSGAQFRLADASGKWLYQGPGTSGWALPEGGSLSPRGRAKTVLLNGKPLRLLSAPVRFGVIQMGVPLGEFYELLEGFTWSVLLASPVLLLLASAGGFWMSRRALQPVEDIAWVAAEIGARDLSGRLPLRGTQDELDRLSETLNAMFERLEASFHRMTQFTADASHELRTPVAIIQATAEMATSRPRTPEEHRKAWALILEQSGRIAHLIDDLMTLARADSGSDGLALQPMDLCAAVHEACAEARVLADAAGLKLTVDLPPECPLAGDHDAVRRLLLILLDNAIKHTPGGGTVSVHLIPGTAPVLTVRDTGVGIGPEDRERIFDRFYRASKHRGRERTRRSEGAGLGLAIAQWIVSRHGGTIGVKSELGAGSVFQISFKESTHESMERYCRNGGAADRLRPGREQTES